ncbi:MFS transporter [Candidatus Methanomassiliicoccus intestinalis]|uniref:MFS transporter n=1 Tax=Candidatus Methanomassiliicoccus intestinalis TaxID=1406512 RepID=UPI0037DC048B
MIGSKSYGAVAALSIAAFMVMTGVSIISPILPAYAASFGIHYALIGIIISSFAIARTFLDIPAGVVAYKLGMKKFMAIGLLLIAASSFVAGYAPTYETLLVARILEGAGSAMYTTVSMTLVAVVSPPERRGATLSFYMSMMLLGTVSGPVIGGFISETWGMSAPFYTYAAFGLISLIIITAAVKETGKSSAAHPANMNVTKLLKDYNLMAICFAVLVTFLIRQGVINTVIPLYAYNNIGIGEIDLGIALGVLAIGNTVMMLIVGKLSDRFGRKIFMMLSLILSAIVVLTIPLDKSLLSLIISMGVLGICLGLAGPVSAWITDVSRPEDLGGAMGIQRTVGDLGFIIGPILLAAIAGASGQTVSSMPFIVAALISVLPVAFLISVKDPVATEKISFRKQNV